MPELMQHQLDGIAFLREHPRAALLDDAGTGKTAQLITAADGPVLIVGPAMVKDGGVYDHELGLWRPELEATVRSYHGIVAKDGRRFLDRPAADLTQRWGTIVFDEAHYLKSRKANWTAAAMALAKRADRIYLASGTPIPNWAYELWTSLRLLRPDDTSLRSYWRWVERWFVIGRTRFSNYDVPGELIACMDKLGLAVRPECADRPSTDPCEHWVEFYQANLGELALRRTREQVLGELPPLTLTRLATPMSGAQLKAYRQLKRDYMVELEHGRTHYAWSDAAKYVKLMQCTSGLAVLDPDATGGSSKLDALRALLRDRGQPTLVLAYYRDTAVAIRRVCTELGLRHVSLGSSSSRAQRRAAVRDFQSGEFDVMVGAIQVVAEGLTLTRADCCIRVERHPVPSKNEQAMRRIHRLGQTRPVTVIDLVTPDSVDAGLLELLDAKDDHQARALSPAQIAAVA